MAPTTFGLGPVGRGARESGTAAGPSAVRKLLDAAFQCVSR
jgi:hypothetical protein